jgi:hypothetical protein
MLLLRDSACNAVNRLPLTVDRPPFSGDSRSLFFVFFASFCLNFLFSIRK